MTLAARRRADAAAFKLAASDAPTAVKRVEIRDGWVYVDGVRTRLSDPGSVTMRARNSMRRGGAKTKGRPR